MMAEATVAPETFEYVVTGTSPTRSAWLWTRALMDKARMGFVNGATKVRVTMAHAMNTTAAAAVAAGAQIALATRAGWNAGTGLLAKVLGGIAKGALWVAKGVSWVMDKIGGFVGWFVGLFNKGAGESVKAANARFTEWRIAKITGVQARVEIAQHIGHAAMTTKSVSTVGRISAGMMGVGTLANIATGGAVAAQVAAVPYIGGWAGMAFGPVGLLVTGAIAVIGGLLSFFFKKEEVADRLEVMETEAMVRKYGIPEDGEIVVNLSPDGSGGTKVSVGGHPVLVRTIKSDPALMAEVAEAAMKGEIDEGVKNRPGKTQAPAKGNKAPAAATA